MTRAPARFLAPLAAALGLFAPIAAAQPVTPPPDAGPAPGAGQGAQPQQPPAQPRQPPAQPQPPQPQPEPEPEPPAQPQPAQPQPEPEAAPEEEPAEGELPQAQAEGQPYGQVVHTAASVAGAPLPQEASGTVHAAPPSGRWLVVPRVLLYIPRGINWLIAAPFRGSAYLYERYQLRERLRAIFFNDEGTVGLFPVAFFETGFGFNIGARFIHRDLFGGGERLRVRASFGGQYEQIYSFKISTGERIQGGRTRVEFEAEYERRPKDRFFGIGNGDEVESVPMPIDPYTNPTAIEGRFQQNIGRIKLIGDLALVGSLSARLSSAVLFKEFGENPDEISDDEEIGQNFDLAALPAFEEGTTYVYNELELRYDTRRSPTRFEPDTMPSTGWLLSGYTGIATSIDRAKTNYVRNGIDLQRYFRLGNGPRLLALRLYGEEVRGNLQEVPFVDLPRLGGPLLLRGYERDRFRDRVAVMGSAEYMFDLTSNIFAGFLFVDAGRVYPGLDDLTFDGLRVGYGGGVQIHTDHSYLGRFTVASNIDGGIEVYFSFDPVYDPKDRVERR